MNADPQPWLQHTLGEDSLRVNDELFSWCCRVRGSIPPSSPSRWPPPPVSSTFLRLNSAPKFIPKFLRQGILQRFYLTNCSRFPPVRRFLLEQGLRKGKGQFSDGSSFLYLLTCYLANGKQYPVRHVGGQQIRPCEVVVVSHHVLLLLHWYPVLALHSSYRTRCHKNSSGFSNWVEHKNQFMVSN